MYQDKVLWIECEFSVAKGKLRRSAMADRWCWLLSVVAVSKESNYIVFFLAHYACLMIISRVV